MGARERVRGALAAASLGMLLNHCSQLDDRRLNEASGGVGGYAAGGARPDASGGLPEGASGKSSGGAQGSGGSAGGNAGQAGNPDGGTTAEGGADPGGAGDAGSGGVTPTGGGGSEGGASPAAGGSSDGGSGGASQPVTYSVTYNGNGALSGTTPVDSQKYQQGETVTVAANPGALARLGYAFAGWNTRSDGKGTNYVSGSGTFQMGTVNATLYAKWIVHDASGNVYTDVTIGPQVWLVENLKTFKYNDGTTIAAVPDPCDDTGRVWTGDPIYGAYYNGHAVRSGKLAPTGWRVPTVNDWNTLIATTQNNAKAMASTLYWRSSTEVGAIGNDPSTNNGTGFSGLPAGYCTSTGTTSGTVGFMARFWTSHFATDEGSYYGDFYVLAYDTPTMEADGSLPACGNGLSVRLVREY